MPEDKVAWAMVRLGIFIEACEPKFVPSPSGTVGFHGYTTSGDESFVIRESAVIEKILDKYTPGWQGTSIVDARFRFRKIYECSARCLALLQDWDEVSENLTSEGPSLIAAEMHPWVWQSAQSAWEAGQFEDAVDAAARGVNSHLRGKTGRKDIGESDLIAQVFSPKPGDETNPRLRLPLPEGTADRTVSALHSGVLNFGQGLFSAVRNPLAHEAPGHLEMSENQCLEVLAAFSLLARWIDAASVRRS